MKDWRLTHQENYLQGKVLRYSRWEKSGKAGWDHDHCEFCWAEFPAEYEAGYCTPDGQHWICPVCYRDFQVQFGWRLET